MKPRPSEMPKLFAVIAVGLTLLGFLASPLIASPLDTESSKLAAAYRQLGLPVPPDDAVLVRAWGAGAHRPGNPNFQSSCTLAFRLPAQAGQPSWLLWGTQVVPENARRELDWTPVTPEKVDAAEVVASSRFPVFEMDNNLAVACQCEARGWHALADTLIGKVPSIFIEREGDRNFTAGITSGPTDLSLESRLNYLAWAHWCNELSDGTTNRRAILERMNALKASEPRLRADKPKMDLLASLQDALAPSNAAPGSIAAQIDALADVAGEPWRFDPAMGSDPRLIALAAQGFAAVPARVEHLHDTRLTRSVEKGSMVIPHILNVGELAGIILMNIAGPEVGIRGPQFQQVLDKWWTEAQKQGEEAYYVTHVFPEQPAGRYRIAYRVMFTILAKRFPDSLPGLWEKMLVASEGVEKQRPSTSFTAIAIYRSMPAYITSSALPQEKKIELLLRAARRTKSQLAAPSTEELKHFDPAEVARVEAKIPRER